MRTHGQICVRTQILHICKICIRMQIWSCVHGFRDKLFINGEQHIPNPTSEQQLPQPSNRPSYTNRQQRSQQYNTTYIGQRFNQQPRSDRNTTSRGYRQQPQFQPRVQGQTESGASWNSPVRPREYQQRTSVNAHSQNDFTTPNRFGVFMNDNRMQERVSAAGKQKARSPLDQDLTLKKQRANSVENEGIEMDTYSIGVTDSVSDNVGLPGSDENGEFTRL